jgi:hypothetical protein
MNLVKTVITYQLLQLLLYIGNLNVHLFSLVHSLMLLIYIGQFTLRLHSSC